MYDPFPDIAATWRITRTYKLYANDKIHALRKLNQALEQGYDNKYLIAQKIVEYREDKKQEKHPWLKELASQLFKRKK